jgi:hypothetical protein
MSTRLTGSKASAGLLALMSNLIEMYADSHKLCYSMQRPLAKRVASIPHTWLLILKMVPERERERERERESL